MISVFICLKNLYTFFNSLAKKRSPYIFSYCSSKLKTSLRANYFCDCNLLLLLSPSPSPMIFVFFINPPSPQQLHIDHDWPKLWNQCEQGFWRLIFNIFKKLCPSIDIIYLKSINLWYIIYRGQQAAARINNIF